MAISGVPEKGLYLARVGAGEEIRVVQIIGEPPFMEVYSLHHRGEKRHPQEVQIIRKLSTVEEGCILP